MPSPVLPIEQPPIQAPTIETVAGLTEANPGGDIFGGWVLAQMDLAGGSCAFSYVGNRAVTAGITDVSFLKPLFVGDIVRFYAKVERVGTTSIATSIKVWANRQGKGPIEKVAQATYTFVAVDGAFRPQPIEKTAAKTAGSGS
jgi:acyl-CoA thioesterase YciA